MKNLVRAAVLLVAAIALAVVARPAAADTAVMTRNGVLYEVLVMRYADVVPSAAGSTDAHMQVVALRTTSPGIAPVLELVDGTVDTDDKGCPSIGYDENTETVLVVYMRFRGALSDLHFAARRAGGWSERYILASAGLYLSLNPQMTVTRQTYVDFDARNGQPVTKARSIVSIIWWEEGGRSQARYAPVFLEDGRLHLDEITPYNLNELAGSGGPTDNAGLPFSSYQFPAVQRDPGSNGGVLVAFANLATRRQNTLRIGFADNVPQLVSDGVPLGPQTYARIHTPIGRGGREGRLPERIDVLGNVGTVVAPGSLVPTFFWNDVAALHVLPGDSPAEAPPTSIVLRPDFTLDRALAVVRDMALSN